MSKVQEMISPSQIFIADNLSQNPPLVEYDWNGEGTDKNLHISDDTLLNISAREVGQIAADLPSDQVKALKQRRRTLKNREYAGKLTFFNCQLKISCSIFLR
jgi:hypothetical protein